MSRAGLPSAWPITRMSSEVERLSSSPASIISVRGASEAASRYAIKSVMFPRLQFGRLFPASEFQLHLPI